MSNIKVSRLFQRSVLVKLGNQPTRGQLICCSSVLNYLICFAVKTFYDMEIESNIHSHACVEAALSISMHIANKVWRSNNITTATKMKLYGTFVIPVMMYGSECWCLRKEDERKILVAEMSWLRRILGRSRRERILNEVTRKELGQQVTLVDKIRKRRLT